MSSIVESMQKRSLLSNNESLPLSQSEPKEPSLRRRLSSLSLKIQPVSSPASSWSFSRSKSMSAMGGYAGTSIRKWWDWGWSWILSRKPVFAKDLEMNEEETRILGCLSKGSLRHIFYKVKSKIGKLGRSDNIGLPQTYKYDSFNYTKNFDDGERSFRG